MKPLLLILLSCLFLIQIGISQVGKVGINTTSPAAMLHVKDSSVLFTGVLPLPTSGNPPANGAGTRMMWYPAKSAFRAGTVDGTQWDKNNIGNYSFATGFSCKASGQYANSIGNNCSAIESSSFAAGSFNVASNFASVAFGHLCNSTGPYSFTMGQESIASGVHSCAIGSRSKAKGNVSFSFGEDVLSKSFGCAVFGRFNDTTSTSSQTWNLNDPVFIVGNGTNNANRSNALTVLKNGNVGINTTTPAAMLHVKDSSVLFTGFSPLPTPGNPPASGAGTRMMWYPAKSAFRAGSVNGTQWDKSNIGDYSFASGFNCIASGLSSISLGISCTAMGNRSLAIGSYNVASNLATVALGDHCSSIEVCAFSMGLENKASGIASFATGFSTKAIGDNSISGGKSTVAKSFACAVFGGYNDTTSINSNIWELNDPVFIIGNGISNSNRSNALTVLKNGNLGIVNNNPAYKLDVSGRMRLRQGTDGSPGIWFNKSDNSVPIAFMGMYNDEFVGLYGDQGSAWNFLMSTITGRVGIGLQNPLQKLHVNGNGLFNGTVTASCGILSCSDIRYKKNIQPLTNVLSGLQMLHGVYYHWDKESFPDIQFNDERQIGIIAQELEKVFPEVVHTDAKGFKTVDYSRLSPVLLEAIKEQQQIIEIQDSKLDHQQKQINELTNRLDKLMEILITKDISLEEPLAKINE